MLNWCDCLSNGTFSAPCDMRLQEIEVFRPCLPMNDGFRVSIWMAAPGRSATAATGQKRASSTLKNDTAEVVLLPHCLQLDMSQT